MEEIGIKDGRLELQFANTGLLVQMYGVTKKLAAEYRDRGKEQNAAAHLRLQEQIGRILYRRLARRGVAALFEVQ